MSDPRHQTKTVYANAVVLRPRCPWCSSATTVISLGSEIEIAPDAPHAATLADLVLRVECRACYVALNSEVPL